MTYLYLKLAEIVLPSDQLTNLPKGSPDSVLQTGLKIVFAIAAAVAVLIIVLAGLRMTTSSGNPDAVTRARNTIVYAAIGLLVALTAFTIVTFVIGHV